MLLSTVFLINTIAISQTVIDYSAWSTSQCNAFYPSASVNSITHTSTCGQPAYNSTNNDVVLDCKITSSITYGTEYKIAYNFRQGYSYSIKINAWAITFNSNDPFPKLRVDFNSASNGSGTSCNGSETINATSSLTANNNQAISTGGFIDYTFNYSSLSTAYSFLYISAIPPANTVYSSIEIKKVTITETGTAELSFPTSLPITCGTTTPQTFTVSNPNNVQNITSYEWNLGSSSNGWLYNGSAAPQNISTTSNSITLTPDCASTLSNVSVTVRVNNQDYKTYNCSVSMTSPNMSIDGGSSFCSGTSSSYSISGLTCDGTVTWSASPSGIVTINSPSSTQTTLTKITNGEIVLTATITTACSGSNIVVQKTVDVGTPGVDGVATNTYYVDDTFALVLYPDAYNLACTNYFVNTDMHITGATSTATWSKISSSGGTVIWTASNNNLHLEIKSTGGTALFQITASNSCGNTVQEYEWLASDCSGEYALAYKVSPNPASDNIQVSSKDKSNTIQEIRITDQTGTLKKRFVYDTKLNSVQINISSLPLGVYYLQIFDGTGWSSVIISKK